MKASEQINKRTEELRQGTPDKRTPDTIVTRQDAFNTAVLEYLDEQQAKNTFGEEIADPTHDVKDTNDIVNNPNDEVHTS